MTKETIVWVASDGSWGSGSFAQRAVSLITSEEWEILEGGTDEDRRNLVLSWTEGGM